MSKKGTGKNIYLKSTLSSVTEGHGFVSQFLSQPIQILYFIYIILVVMEKHRITASFN